MKRLYKGLTALGIAALLAGGGIGAYCLCNNVNTTEKVVQETTTNKKETKEDTSKTTVSKTTTTEQANTDTNTESTTEESVQGIGSGVYDDLGNYVNHTYKVAVDELNVRDAASTSANSVSMMHAGDEVYVGQVKMNQEDGSIWALVNDGWVCIHDQQGNWFLQMQ